MAALDSHFSTFINGGDLVEGDTVVGLRNGLNTKFNNTGGVGTFLPLAGGTMTGSIDMDGNAIINLPSPGNPLDATNKAYVDAKIQAGTNWADSAGADTYRGQVDTPGAEATLTDAERTFLVDRVVDESSLLKVTRKVTMNRSRVEIPRMSLGTRVMRAASAGGHPEGVMYDTTVGDPSMGFVGGPVAPTFSTIVLTSSKVVLPWVISNEFLEDNPEQGAAEAHIAEIMGRQAANDLEDLAINGDEGSNDQLLRANDGYLAQVPVNGSDSNPRQVDFMSGAFTTNTLETILRTMPTKYRRNLRDLRFIVSPDTWMDYVQSIASRQGNMADQALAGILGDPTYGGVPIMASPFMPSDTVLLTHPDNLVFGVERDMRLTKTADGYNAIYHDERYYALHMRCDFLIQDTDAVVRGDNIAARTP